MSIYKVNAEILDSIINEMNKDNEQGKVYSGYSFIDEGDISLERLSLNILYEEKNCGSSSFALNIVKNILLNNGNVRYFTREKSGKRVLQVLLGIVADVPTLHGKVEIDSECKKLVDASEKIKNSGLVIEEAFDFSVEKIYSHCVDLDVPLDLIIIDSIEKLNSIDYPGGKERVYDRLRKLSHICKCPVLALDSLDEEIDKMIYEKENIEKIIDKIEGNYPVEWFDNIWLLYRKNNPEEKKNNELSLVIVNKINGRNLKVNDLKCDLGTLIFY